MHVRLIGFLCAVLIFTFVIYYRRVGATEFCITDLERLVETQKLRQDAHAPVRMVVYVKDHSLFVTSNSFEEVVYDETDQIDHDPDALSGFWPDPGSRTGVSDVGFGRKLIEKISGHFYHVWIADP
jgi:hypothetical protein